jgi:hypothetical protein
MNVFKLAFHRKLFALLSDCGAMAVALDQPLLLRFTKSLTLTTPTLPISRML